MPSSRFSTADPAISPIPRRCCCAAPRRRSGPASSTRRASRPDTRSRPPLAQAEKEAYFEITERFDLAFVPEVLADVGAGKSSATGFAARVGAWHVGRIETILRHGDRFLDPAGLRHAIRRATRKYLCSLAWRFCLLAPLRDPEFVRYQRLALDHLLPRLQREDMGWESSGLHLADRLLGSRARVGSELRA